VENSLKFFSLRADVSCDPPDRLAVTAEQGRNSLRHRYRRPAMMLAATAAHESDVPHAWLRRREEQQQRVMELAGLDGLGKRLVGLLADPLLVPPQFVIDKVL